MSKKKPLTPFTGKPLVVGKGQGLQHWRQEREKQRLRDEIGDMAKVVRRLSQELIEGILFLQDSRPKSPEETRRVISGMAAALKAESSTLNSLFQIGELHPMLEQIFRERADARSLPTLDLINLSDTQGDDDNGRDP